MRVKLLRKIRKRFEVKFIKDYPDRYWLAIDRKNGRYIIFEGEEKNNPSKSMAEKLAIEVMGLSFVRDHRMMRTSVKFNRKLIKALQVTQ